MLVLVLVLVLVANPVPKIGHDFKERLAADPSGRWGHESERYAGDRRMDSGFVEAHPYRRSDDRIDRDFADPDTVEQRAKSKASQCQKEVTPCDRFGKDRGDHENR